MPYEEPRQGKDYFKFVGGHFVQKCDPSDPKAVKRTYVPTKGPNKGKEQTVYEKHYKSLTGYLTDIKRKSVEWDGGGKGYFWEFHFSDLENEFCISFPYDSQIATMFLYRLPNLQYNKMITVTALYFQNDDKIAISIKQDGNPHVNANGTIDRYWDKDSTDMPQIKWISNGMGGHDKDKASVNTQNEWLWQYIQKEVIPKISLPVSPKEDVEDHAADQEPIEDAVPADQEPSGETYEDDLPF